MPPPVGNAARSYDRDRSDRVDDRGNEWKGRDPPGVTTGLRPLRGHGIHAGRGRLPCRGNCTDLAQDKRAGVVSERDEWSRVRERHRDDPDTFVERHGHQLRRAREVVDEAHAEWAIGERTGLTDLVDQPRRTVHGRAADEPQPAGLRHGRREHARRVPPPIGAFKIGYSTSRRSHRRVCSTMPS